MSLDWDVVIGILGFIFFIIVPALSRKKTPKKQPPGTQQAARKPQQQRTTAHTASAAPQAAPTPEAPPEPGSLAELLATIREQVAEAQARESGAPSASMSSAPTSTVDPVVVTPAPQRNQPRPLFSAPERRLRDVGLTKRDGMGTEGGLGRIRPTARRASVRTFTDTVEEEVALAPALVQLDSRSVIQGMIWHEILGERKGLNGTRRMKLPLR